jgi:hypothetical protein
MRKGRKRTTHQLYLGFIERRREGEWRPGGHKPLMAMAVGGLMAFKRGPLGGEGVTEGGDGEE